MIPENGSTSLTADSPFIYPSNFFQETIFRVCLTVFNGVVCLEVQIPMLQLPSSSIKPPSQISPPPPTLLSNKPSTLFSGEESSYM